MNKAKRDASLKHRKNVKKMKLRRKLAQGAPEAPKSPDGQSAAA